MVTEGNWPSRRAAWLAVALLSVAAVLSQLDRMIINLVVEPVKQDFNLSDTRFAMLQALAFGAFYTVMALPLGRMADVFQRRLVIGVGVAIFSLFSVATGLTRTYAQLFIARCGVGIGEASQLPSGCSLLSDYFPPERRGLAISIFTMSSMVGTALAYIIGGALIGWLGKLHAVSPDVFWGLAPWQFAFVLIGAPGLFIAPLFLLLKEPPRRDMAAGSPRSLPISFVAQEVWKQRAVLGFMFAGFSMVTLTMYSITVWTPALFIRVYHWTAAEIGMAFGLVFLCFGVTGGIVAGHVMDRLRARGVVSAPLKVAGYGFVASSLFGGLAPLMPTPILALVFLAPTMFAATIPYPCAIITLQSMFPNQIRAQVNALYLMVITLVGLGCGPVIVGLFSDRIFTAPSGVRYSLAIVVGAAGPIMLLFTLLASRFYRPMAKSEPASLYEGVPA